MRQYGVKKAANSHQKGFTLIELSVVIVIIGIIISAIATVLPSLIYSSKIKKARAILEKIDYAVQGYAIANNRLPFAAGANDGLETTDTFIGYLPYQSLGLSSGQDPWGNAIRYAVYGVAGGTANLTATFTDTDAFCTALTQASTAAFDATIVHPTTAATCGSADSTNSANQAYILVSGGAKDLDGAAGFFDACNDPATPTFNAPNKIIDNSYDDLTVAFSINELIQRICSGGGGGGSGAAGENTYANGCTNGSDDDGDGAVDCADSDCAGDPACAAGSVAITTTTLPSADLNSTYSTTINATGGLTPYQWTLTNNGGFTGLTLNSFSGQLTGPLDQCPGTYNIIADIQDNTLPADGGPLTDSATLALTVTSNLSVVHTSGGGSVTWSSALQTETFQATGDWLGTLNWTLNSGGATGFAVKSSGSDGAVLYKTGSTATGSYTFTITATDSSCPTNSADIVLSVDVQAAGSGVPGGITGIVDTQTYNYPTEAYTPKLISLGGSVFAVSHRSQSGYDNGYLRTTEIGTDGTITTAERDYTFFNYTYNAWGNPVSRTTSVFDPDAIKVSDTVTAVAFTSADGGGQGILHTVSVDSSGPVGDGFMQSLVFEAGQCGQPDLIHVSGDIYAVVYSGPGNDGWIKTVNIDGTTGAMTLTGYQLEFDTTYGAEPSIVKVGDGLFAVAYRGSGNNGDLKSLSIDAAGVITELDGLSGGFDNNCYKPALITIDSTTLAVAYSGSGSDGWLKTISIDASGMLSLTGSELEFDNNYGNEPDMVYMGADIYAVAYRGPGDNGRLKTISIDPAGSITEVSSLTASPPPNDFYYNNNCYEPSIVRVDHDTAAIFYRGQSNQGTLVTVGFQ
jgi:prepilin-type N-terminal cleavage/methylation domain-containing protein